MIKKELKPIFVRLTKQQYEKLQEISNKGDIPVSSLVRLSVSKYLEMEEKHAAK